MKEWLVKLDRRQRKIEEQRFFGLDRGADRMTG